MVCEKKYVNIRDRVGSSSHIEKNPLTIKLVRSDMRHVGLLLKCYGKEETV